MICISHHNACECREQLHREAYLFALLLARAASDHDGAASGDPPRAARSAWRLAQVQYIGVELGYINPTTEGDTADD